MTQSRKLLAFVLVQAVIMSCSEGKAPTGNIHETAAAVCGNGAVETGETCDTAIVRGDGSCPRDCDDGDPCTVDGVQGTGCQVSCLSLASPGCCGNGTLDGDELCDTAINTGIGSCPSSCDDGDPCTLDLLVDADTCRTHCVATPDAECCGDGEVDGQELCDTAIPLGEPGACPTTCAAPDACSMETLRDAGTCWAECDAIANPACCGNGSLDSGEVCDTAVATGEFGACPESCDDGHTCTSNDNYVGCSGFCRGELQPLCFEAAFLAPVPYSADAFYPPALLSVGEELWLFGGPGEAQGSAYLRRLVWGETGWSDAGQVAGGGSEFTPAALEFALRPVIAVATGTGQVWINAYNEDQTWEWDPSSVWQWEAISGPGRTDASLDAGGFGDELYLFGKLAGAGAQPVTFTHAQSAGTFAAWSEVPGGAVTEFGPTVYEDGTQLVVVVAGPSGLQANAFTGSWSGWTAFGPSVTPSSAPRVALVNGTLILVVVAGGEMKLASRPLDGTWTAWTTLPVADAVGQPDIVVHQGRLYIGVQRTGLAYSYSLWETAPPM